MVFLLFFITITLFIYGLFLLPYQKKAQMQKRLTAFLSDEPAMTKQTATTMKQPSLFHRFLFPLLEDYKRSFKKRMPGEKVAKLEEKLQLAGNPWGMTPVDFRLLQIGILILLPLVFTSYGMLFIGGTGTILLFSLIGLAAGLFLPHFYLKQKMKTRHYRALKELPDILDLLTVSLEAGLGFDAAVNKVAAKKDGVISDEFHRSLEEIRLGKTRREALTGIRDRIDVEEVKSFINSILQAEKLGIGMVQVMRAQSSDVREKRKQRAEEAAMKAPIKMLFPLVFFIFPTLFIVILGPAVIQFVQAFSNR